MHSADVLILFNVQSIGEKFDFLIWYNAGTRIDLLNLMNLEIAGFYFGLASFNNHNCCHS